MSLKAKIKPSNLDISRGLVGSLLRNSEKEAVARNLIILSRLNGNEWLEFSWKEYQEKCTHRPSKEELRILGSFVNDGLLKNEDGKFIVCDEFIKSLWKFVDESV